ncbi:MAG: helix-turn-helix domain-containing protein [Oscillospiraceae bacterium]|jgi:TPR repeat protein/DNA-binding XRE family transcriptional regulator|nr:helix-turn-helix domain-containing protein [Oscillospiraceae bacterium]
MELAIGGNIKRLRGEQGATQEKLADYLGVTTRAVSKWETGKAYPDITLLGGIAAFFGVSLDELMADRAERNDKVRTTELLMKILDNRAVGKHDENIKLLRKAAKENPNDFMVQLLLATELYNFGVIERAILDAHNNDAADNTQRTNNSIREAAGICQRVLKLCNDDTMRQSAVKLAFILYDALGDTENAREMYAKLPSIDNSNALLLPSYLTSDERKAAIQGTIKTLTDTFYQACLNLAAAGSNEFGYDYERQSAIIRKAVDMYLLVYENGDFGTSAANLQTAYGVLSRLAAEHGDAENALAYLELAAKYAIAYVTRPLQPDLTGLSGMFYTAYTSVLIDARRDFAINETHANEHNLCWDLMHTTKFNPTVVALIGDSERFKAVIAELERYAETERESQNPFDFAQNLKKAESGDENYMFILAGLYWQGIGVEQDMEEAAKWLRRAADKDHTGALNDLGELYRLGVGVPRDYAEAMKLYRRADEVPTPFGVGNPFSRANIGDLYRHGLGVERDYAEAIRWYELADGQDYPHAQYRLGEMYENGEGVARDLRRALEYYEKAAVPNPHHPLPESLDEVSPYDTSNTATRPMVNDAIERVRGQLIIDN